WSTGDVKLLRDTVESALHPTRVSQQMDSRTGRPGGNAEWAYYRVWRGDLQPVCWRVALCGSPHGSAGQTIPLCGPPCDLGNAHWRRACGRDHRGSGPAWAHRGVTISRRSADARLHLSYQ